MLLLEKYLIVNELLCIDKYFILEYKNNTK